MDASHTSAAVQDGQRRGGLPVVAVFGAYGYTGRFVVAELLAFGCRPLLTGRDAERLAEISAAHSGLVVRAATVESPDSLDRALDGAAAVVNCAGPFMDTAAPLIEAALRTRVHYLDVTAEQVVARAAFERFAEPARTAGVMIVPAMGFYGGLGDLLTTAAMGDWETADEVAIGTALDRWQPTLGTRRTGQRNVARRLVVSNGRLEPLADPAPRRSWSFPEPFGAQEVVEIGLSEIVTIFQHLRASEVHAFLSAAPLRDLRDPDTPPPAASDTSGRSPQVFLTEVIVRKGSEERRAVARGRDIYAVSGSLIAAAACRAASGRVSSAGVFAPGEAFDARELLSSLLGPYFSFEIR